MTRGSATTLEFIEEHVDFNPVRTEEEGVDMGAADVIFDMELAE